MARCGCGSVRCPQVRSCITAGPGIVYDPETGVIATDTDPDIDCTMVRGCLSAGDGLAYDEATGMFTARPSGDTGNNLAFGGDGGLFVPTGAATVTTGCGVTGDGSAAAPVAVNAGEWPYECDPAAEGGVVACGPDGQLRGEPPSRFFADTLQANNSFEPVPAPAEFTTVETPSITFPNPSPCKPALALIALEVDVDFHFPAGAAGGYRFGGDTMYYHTNPGSSTQFGEHTQTLKVAHIEVDPGDTGTFSTPIQVQGSGGATYQRVQYNLRAWVFAL